MEGMTRNELKSRLALLGKRNIDVVLEMQKNGFDVSNEQFSRAFSETAKEPKQRLIRQKAECIIDEWATKKEV